jgi:hypothetical protein
MKKKETPPFIMVYWEDSCEPAEDVPHELDYFDKDARRIVPTVSVGICLKDDERGVVLCRDFLYKHGNDQGKEIPQMIDPWDIFDDYDFWEWLILA